MEYIAHNGHSANGAIIGTVLGDGCLVRSSPTANTYLRLYHSANQRDYLEFKRNYLRAYLPNGTVKIYERQLDNPFTGESSPYMVADWCSGVDKRLNYHHDDFYPKGKKIAKRSVLNRLTPLGLALWFMDDGSVATKNGLLESVRLHINGFDEQSKEVIINWFKDQLGFNFRVEKADGAIKSDTKTAWRFLAIVKPFVNLVPSMSHKADIDRFRREGLVYGCLPEFLKDRIEGRDQSVPDRGYVWQVFNKDLMFPLQVCKHCGTEFRRKRESYFCSPTCNSSFQGKSKRQQDYLREYRKTYVRKIKTESTKDQ